jgi:hypothetical protein
MKEKRVISALDPPAERRRGGVIALTESIRCAAACCGDSDLTDDSGSCDAGK